jgi:hypothetical protein
MKSVPKLFGILTLNTACLLSIAGEPIDDGKLHIRAAALYADKEHSKKCAAVFDILKKNLKPGMTSAKAAEALGKARWLEHTHSGWITMLGGWIPVDSKPFRAFNMSLYPNSDKWSNYVVYFSLTPPDDEEFEFTIEEFLQGKVKDKSVKLHQFALCHPGKDQTEIGRIEVFPPPPKDSEQDAVPNGP